MGNPGAGRSFLRAIQWRRGTAISPQQAGALAVVCAACACASASYGDLIAARYPASLFGWLLATRFLSHALQSVVKPGGFSPLDSLTTLLAVLWTGLHAHALGPASLAWVLPVQLAIMLFVDTSRLAAAMAFAGVFAMLAGPDAGGGVPAALTLACASGVALAARQARGGWHAPTSTPHATSSHLWGSASALRWDADEQTTVYSPAFKAMLGYSAGKSRTPYNFFDLVHSADRPALERAFRAETRAARMGRPLSGTPAQVRLVARDGNWRWVRADIVSLRLQGGRASECVATFVDVTPEVVAQEALVASRRSMQMQSTELAATKAGLQRSQDGKVELERQVGLAFQAPLLDLRKSLTDLQALTRQMPQPEGQAGLIELAQGHLDDATRRLQWVLDASRLEDGRYRPRRGPIDMGVLAMDIVSALAPLARLRTVTLDLAAESPGVRALGDAAMSGKALEALGREAVLSAPKGARIVLAVVERAERVGLELRMANAMRASQRSRFFDPPAPSQDLLPLGPYAARLVARAQGGDLTLGTASSGAASLFFMLPIEPAPAHQETASVLDIVVLGSADCGHQVEQACQGWDVSVRQAADEQACVDAVIERRPDFIVAEHALGLDAVRRTMALVREMQASAAEPITDWLLWAARGDGLPLLAFSDFAGCIEEGEAGRAIEELLRQALAEKNARGDAVWVDPSILRAMPDYLASRKSLVVALRQAIEAGRRAEAARLAHLLGGSPGLQGFEAAVAACRIIGNSASTEPPEKLLSLVAEIDALVDRMRSA